MRWIGIGGLVLALVAALGCAPTMVQVPPRVDLGQWPTIGIVEFAYPQDPELAQLATSRFVEVLQEGRPGTRILELGPAAEVLEEVGFEQLDPEAVRALCERYRVDAVFTGALEISSVKPNLHLGRLLSSLHAGANLDGELAAQLLEAGSGALAWSRSARASESVSHLALRADGTDVRVGGRDEALTGLVWRLAVNATGDFRPSWREE